jgi:choice-of-anchor C domain-containing protein
MKKTLLLGIIAVLLLACVGAVSAVNLVQNPGFETSGAVPVNPGFLTSPPGSLGTWTISGTVDVIRNYWQPHSGDQSLDLAGNGPGEISQSIPTVAGGTYQLSFWMAGNPDNPDPAQIVKGLEIHWNGNPLTPIQTFDASSSTHAAMGWTLVTIPNLVATGSSTILEFENEYPNNAYGVALDDISVERTDQPIPTPEFPTVALPVALIVGLIGAVLFIRNTKE